MPPQFARRERKNPPDHLPKPAKRGILWKINFSGRNRHDHHLPHPPRRGGGQPLPHRPGPAREQPHRPGLAAGPGPGAPLYGRPHRRGVRQRPLPHPSYRHRHLPPPQPAPPPLPGPPGNLRGELGGPDLGGHRPLRAGGHGGLRQPHGPLVHPRGGDPGGGAGPGQGRRGGHRPGEPRENPGPLLPRLRHPPPAGEPPGYLPAGHRGEVPHRGQHRRVPAGVGRGSPPGGVAKRQPPLKGPCISGGGEARPGQAGLRPGAGAVVPPSGGPGGRGAPGRRLGGGGRARARPRRLLDPGGPFKRGARGPSSPGPGDGADSPGLYPSGLPEAGPGRPAAGPGGAVHPGPRRRNAVRPPRPSGGGVPPGLRLCPPGGGGGTPPLAKAHRL